MSCKKKDHIALPNATLSKFVESGKTTFSYIDLTNGDIKTKGPSMYEKEKGYYLEYFDNICQYFETWIGNSRKTISSVDSSTNNLIYDRDELKQIIVELISLQWIRRKELIETIMDADKGNERISQIESDMFNSGRINASVINKIHEYRNMLANDKQKRDYFYSNADKRMAELEQTLLNQGLDGLRATIVKIPDSIKATFLLTPYHFIMSKNMCFFVLEPRYSLALFPPKAFEPEGRETCGIWEMSNESDVEVLIPICIEMAKNCTPTHLIGEEYMLKKIQQYL